MAINECIPRHGVPSGSVITCQTTAAVTGKRLVKITGDRTSGPGLSNTPEGSNYQVGPVAAGDESFGVAKYDAASGAKVGVHTAGIVPITAGATITFWQQVEADSQGRVIPHASGTPIGRAMAGCASASDADIKLYQ